KKGARERGESSRVSSDEGFDDLSLPFDALVDGPQQLPKLGAKPGLELREVVVVELLGVVIVPEVAQALEERALSVEQLAAPHRAVLLERGARRVGEHGAEAL